MISASILIMDQSRETRAMYGDYFRHHGFVVAEAASGEEAIRLFRELQPDLVVTEISTEPQWVRALRMVRGNGTARKTATIACSTTIDGRWPFAPAGIDVDVALGKPLSPRRLLDEARRLLTGSTATLDERVPAL